MQFLSPFLLPFILFISHSMAVLSDNIVDVDRRARSENFNYSIVASTITVDQNGHGNFKTIQAALDFIPSRNNAWIKVKISPGTYGEKVTIPLEKPYVFLEGQGREKTIVTFGDHERTDTSATFTSFPDNVVVKGISFKNSYNCALCRSNVNVGDLNSKIAQALAARIYGDKSAFIECGFLGFQDTLWDVGGRHYFSNCYIQGAIDFIFGSAQSFYENTSINVTAGSEIAFGFVTANGRASSNDPSGFVFKEGSVSGSGQVFLGRAYGAYSTVIFDGVNLDRVVAPQGWNAWSHVGQEWKFTYIEIDCKGPGSDISKRVSWEKKPDNMSQVKQKYSRSSFIDQEGWIARLPQ